MISLDKVKQGERVVIRRIDGGGAMVQRMAEMGLRPGVEIKLIRLCGPAIIELSGHRVIVGRGMVGRVMVESRGGGMEDSD